MHLFICHRLSSACCHLLQNKFRWIIFLQVTCPPPTPTCRCLCWSQALAHTREQSTVQRRQESTIAWASFNNNLGSEFRSAASSSTDGRRWWSGEWIIKLKLKLKGGGKTSKVYIWTIQNHPNPRKHHHQFLLVGEQAIHVMSLRGWSLWLSYGLLLCLLLIIRIIIRMIIRWEKEQLERKDLVQKTCSRYRGLGKERVKSITAIIIFTIWYQHYRQSWVAVCKLSQPFGKERVKVTVVVIVLGIIDVTVVIVINVVIIVIAAVIVATYEGDGLSYCHLWFWHKVDSDTKLIVTQSWLWHKLIVTQMWYKVKLDSFLYSSEHHLLYCRNAKVSSFAWQF